VDASGLVLAVVITAASIQDRDGAPPLLWNLHRACRRVRLVWADAGYNAAKLATWAGAMTMTLQIVARPDLTDRIQTVLEVRDLRTLTEDVTMIRPPPSVRTSAAFMGPPRIGSGAAGSRRA
jgi:transposase